MMRTVRVFVPTARDSAAMISCTVWLPASFGFAAGATEITRTPAPPDTDAAQCVDMELRTMILRTMDAL